MPISETAKTNLPHINALYWMHHTAIIPTKGGYLQQLDFSGDAETFFNSGKYAFGIGSSFMMSFIPSASITYDGNAGKLDIGVSVEDYDNPTYTCLMDQNTYLEFPEIDGLRSGIPGFETNYVITKDRLNYKQP